MSGSPELAYKAYEIEELVDVCFYRRIGYRVALASRAARLTPNAVSVIAAGLGVAGGALLYEERFAFVGCLLLVLHGVFDSADGQLARITNTASEFGRILDGVAGYLTHISVFVALALAAVGRGAGSDTWLWAALAGLSVIVHAQLYEYHRMSYLRYAIQGVVPAGGTSARATAERRDASGSPLVSVFYGAARVYEAMQARLTGIHPRVEQVIARRATDHHVAPADRARYRACFYAPVRGWNALGDNTRRYALIVLALARELEWFVPFVLGPMNLLTAALSWWQWRADRRFLAAG